MKPQKKGMTTFKHYFKDIGKNKSWTQLPNLPWMPDVFSESKKGDCYGKSSDSCIRFESRI